MKKILSIFLALLFLSSQLAQLIPPTGIVSRILGPNAEAALDLLVVGYGDHGVLVTASGEYTTTEFLMHIESIKLDVENPNEWTISWNSADGESYHLAYFEDNFYAVGDDNGVVTSIYWPHSECGGEPELTHEEMVSDFLNNSLRYFVDYNDEAGGDAYYTGDEPFSYGPSFLAVAMDDIQNSEIDAYVSGVDIMDTISVWGQSYN